LKSESILKSNKRLSRLRNSFKYICDPTQIDICAELYELDENGKKAMNTSPKKIGLNLHFVLLYL